VSETDEAKKFLLVAVIGAILSVAGAPFLIILVSTGGQGGYVVVWRPAQDTVSFRVGNWSIPVNAGETGVYPELGLQLGPATQRESLILEGSVMSNGSATFLILDNASFAKWQNRSAGVSPLLREELVGGQPKSVSLRLPRLDQYYFLFNASRASATVLVTLMLNETRTFSYDKPEVVFDVLRGAGLPGAAVAGVGLLVYSLAGLRKLARGPPRGGGAPG